MSDIVAFDYARLDGFGAVKEVIRLEGTNGTGAEVAMRGPLPRNCRALTRHLTDWAGDGPGFRIHFEEGTESSLRPGVELAIVAALHGLGDRGTVYSGEVNSEGDTWATLGTLTVARALGVRRLVTGNRYPLVADWPFEHLVVGAVDELSDPRTPPARLVVYPPDSLPALEARLQPAADEAGCELRKGQTVCLMTPRGTNIFALGRRLSSELGRPSGALAREVELYADLAGPIWDGGVPLRTPPISANELRLFGRESWSRPGDVHLAHGGLLLLEHATDLGSSLLRRVLMMQKSAEAPRFALLGTARPCACDVRGDEPCTCSAAERARHRTRLESLGFDRLIDGSTAG